MEPQVVVLPPLDKGAARKALALVDNLIDRQKKLVDEADKSSMALAALVSEISSKGYWMARGYQNEKEYIEATFRGSRSQYYILKRVWDKLGSRYPTKLLETIGISKCQDLIRVQDHFNGMIPGNWIIWAQEEGRDKFRMRVRAQVGRALPPPEDNDLHINLKIWESAVPVWKKALEIAALEAGTDKSVSHLIILILGDYLAGHTEEGARLGGKYSFTISTVKELIKTLKGCPDHTVWDRLVGAIREAIEESKD